VKKGRHRRFEEARELKRGPDIDIESILDTPGTDSDADADDEDDQYDPYANYSDWGTKGD
jgi:hypothetical protein